MQTLAEPTSPASYNVVISEPENPPRYLFTPQLTVPATAARNGCKYRCVVTDAGRNVAYSNPATLTVK